MACSHTNWRQSKHVSGQVSRCRGRQASVTGQRTALPVLRVPRLQGGRHPSPVLTVAAAAAAAAEDKEEEEEEAPATGIGHFFGALRIDGFRSPCAFKRTIDDWISAFRACPPVVDGRPVLIPGDPEWAQMESRGQKGVPVKMAVVADLVDISRQLGVPLPFDQKVDVSGIR
eukprot:COSAG01_NODE_472_length_16538_cov_126.145690_18_plen_171_part_01